MRQESWFVLRHVDLGFQVSGEANKLSAAGVGTQWSSAKQPKLVRSTQFHQPSQSLSLFKVGSERYSTNNSEKRNNSNRRRLSETDLRVSIFSVISLVEG